MIPPEPDNKPVSRTWLADVYQKIRTHKITPENMWLVATAAALAVELTSSLQREDRLDTRIRDCTCQEEA